MDLCHEKHYAKLSKIKHIHLILIKIDSFYEGETSYSMISTTISVFFAIP